MTTDPYARYKVREYDCPNPDCEDVIAANPEATPEGTCATCGQAWYAEVDGDGETSVDLQKVIWRDGTQLHARVTPLGIELEPVDGLLPTE